MTVVCCGVNSSALARLNLKEMNGALSLTVMNYICGLNYVYWVVFCSFWWWMALEDVSDLEISLIVALWEIVTISIQRIDDWNKKPITQELSYELLIMRIIFPFFLITGLEQFNRQLNIQHAQMALWRSRGLCWRALSHHPPVWFCRLWRGTVPRHSASLSGLFPPKPGGNR